MADHVVLLSVPGLRKDDLSRMRNLATIRGQGSLAQLVPSFPCVTWPVQANMLTGVLSDAHGVVGNGFFWRDEGQVEMWTAWNDKIQVPQIWDRLLQHDAELTSAVWFPMLSKGCGASYVCMPAPIHNPDGSESLWCYTKPTELYGSLRDELGHFPLQRFWGPQSGIEATAWIIDSAVLAARKFLPKFFYIYLPHLDYAAQRNGPDSPQALAAVDQLDQVLGQLHSQLQDLFADGDVLWLVASEYTIVPVSHVSYPNRILRSAELLRVHLKEDGEHLDIVGSPAWALADHQMSHVFVNGRDESMISRVAELFQDTPGIEEILVGEDRGKYHLDHPRSGDVVLISSRDSWQAYYWWMDDAQAPGFARTVDIHRKPGYDPVELHWDRQAGGIPLDATLIAGSHGAPAATNQQCGVLVSSRPGVPSESRLADVDVAGLVLNEFGIT